MEVDTGASLSIVNEKTWLKIGDLQDLQGAEVTLKSYTGEHVQILGKSEPVSQTVVKGEGPNLFGRNWLLI